MVIRRILRMGQVWSSLQWCRGRCPAAQCSRSCPPSSGRRTSRRERTSGRTARGSSSWAPSAEAVSNVDVSGALRTGRERVVRSHHSVGDDDARRVPAAREEALRVTAEQHERLLLIHVAKVLHHQPELLRKCTQMCTVH